MFKLQYKREKGWQNRKMNNDTCMYLRHKVVRFSCTLLHIWTDKYSTDRFRSKDLNSELFIDRYSALWHLYFCIFLVNSFFTRYLMNSRIIHRRNRTWEKDRRDRLNLTFEQLAQLLPEYRPKLNLSKIEILQKSIDYVQALRGKLKDLLATQNGSMLSMSNYSF